ncbi:unnamed protein product [Diatraea saccharalis]|uniref:Uncharacterized protein n=1 Tax=Diatraea saccharalis TaxID=40085 RepID=A0A9N9N221_9NEOP|nr:unnamed protein product [Diatraea saccharalis]
MMTCRLGSRRLGGSRGSLQAGTACTAASELDLSTRSRRAHKASGEAPLLSGWRSTPHTPHTPATPAPHHSHNHLAPPHCNGTDSGSRGGLRRRSTYASGRLRSGPHWSFVFDPAGRLCYYWSMVVSLAFLYNLWVIVYRRDTNSVVLLGLLFGLPVSGGHIVPLPYGVSRRWRPTNGRGEAESALHELHDVLHRLSLSTTARLSLLINRI